MLRELRELLATMPPDATHAEYGAAIVEENALGKPTLATRRRVSELIQAVEPSIQGRLLVFFPGTKNENNYRLLDARDGWSYLAQPITLHEGWVP